LPASFPSGEPFVPSRPARAHLPLGGYARGKKLAGVEPAAGDAPVRWFRLEACAATGWEFLWVYHLRHDGPITVNPEEIQYGE
jgi:hypothetical protein